MQRVVKGRNARISVTFTDLNGDPADPSPDSATVAIATLAGTVIQASTAATNASSGQFTYNLTPTHTANLDTLVCTWTATVSGLPAESRITFVEVVGDYLFEIADARALGMAQATADIAAARTVAESAIEDACGCAFVPRYRRETHSGDGLTGLGLSRRDVRRVRDVTVDGTTLTDLSDITHGVSRILYRPGGWTYGTDNVVVGYEHGMDYSPPLVSKATLLLAKHYLVGSDFDPRVIQAKAGDEQIMFANPSATSFGIPEVDEVVRNYSAVMVG